MLMNYLGDFVSMSNKLIVPCVHLNGTSGQDLLDQIDDAFMAIDAAIEALAKAAPNGRDYYVYGSEAYTQAADQHQARMQKLREVRDQLMAIMNGIHDNEQFVEVE